MIFFWVCSSSSQIVFFRCKQQPKRCFGSSSSSIALPILKKSCNNDRALWRIRGGSFLAGKRRISKTTTTTTVEATQKEQDTTNSELSYRTNKGFVEGVWIFCRHGDRTPGRMLCPSHRRNEEGAFWTSRLPYPNTMQAFDAFCRYFPPSIYPGTNQGEFLDTKRNPYGFLTQRGLTQLSQNGQFFFQRYNRHASHLMEKLQWRTGKAQDFLNLWDFQVYSTNYTRTILSAQSFLDGFFDTNCFQPISERSIHPHIVQESPVPDHNYVLEKKKKNNNHPAAAAPSSNPLVSVRVRKLSQDPLNAFDRNPDAMAEFVGMVMKNKEFHARDSAAAPLAARLANIIPGLYRPHRSDFSSRSPSGINWVEAADHFVCREAHGIPLSKFSNFEDDDRIEQTLKAMSVQTKAHLSWRFRQWYRNRFLLASITAPPLNEVVTQMEQAAQGNGAQKRPFTLYSCHDITILGLLYGLGATFLTNEKEIGSDFWPPYACSLVLELVRTHENDLVVRILLFSDKMMKCRTIDCLRFDARFINPYNFPQRPSGPHGMLTISDLRQLVTAHEMEGGDVAKIDTT